MAMNWADALTGCSSRMCNRSLSRQTDAYKRRQCGVWLMRACWPTEKRPRIRIERGKEKKRRREGGVLVMSVVHSTATRLGTRYSIHSPMAIPYDPLQAVGQPTSPIGLLWFPAPFVSRIGRLVACLAVASLPSNNTATKNTKRYSRNT